MFLQCLSHIDKQHIFYITYIKNTVRAPGARWGLQWDGPTRGRGGGLEKKTANLAKDRAPPCTYMIIYVYMYIYTCMCVYQWVYTCIYIYIHMYIFFAGVSWYERWFFLCWWYQPTERLEGFWQVPVPMVSLAGHPDDTSSHMRWWEHGDLTTENGKFCQSTNGDTVWSGHVFLGTGKNRIPTWSLGW